MRWRMSLQAAVSRPPPSFLSLGVAAMAEGVLGSLPFGPSRPLLLLSGSNAAASKVGLWKMAAESSLARPTVSDTVQTPRCPHL